MASGEPEPGAEVRWDWPDGGGAPFDASEATTRWVLVVGNTFGRTWPAGDLLDFGSWTTDFERRVPMGYKTIRATERLAVVDRGTVVREWPPTRQERPRPVHDPYQHHVPGFEPDGTFAVLDGQGSKRGPDGRWISHEHDSYAAALAEARGMTDRRVLVVRLLTEKGWH
jgi:hypothetical protein